MTRYNKREKSWTKSKDRRRNLLFKYKFWSNMFDVVKTKNLGFELEAAKNKRKIEDLNKKVIEVNNNYQKSVKIVNEWMELFNYQLKVTEEWKEKYYIEFIKK
jgi:hypothetical protein